MQARGALGGGNAPELYDDNNNGRFTCAEAERHGIAPVPRGHPTVSVHERRRQRRRCVCEGAGAACRISG